jgi:Outer membrane protein beta-barrel domain
MMQRRIKVLLLAAAAAVVLAPSQARADGFFIPFAGLNFGNQPVEGNHSNFGFSAGGMGGGIIGGEVDFGYAPNIFEESVGNHVLTFTGNLIVGVPVGGQSGLGIRPYLVGGVGYMRSHQDASPGFAELNGNDFGFDLGGGVMGFFSDHVGLRGDLRYFRNITSDLFDSDSNPELNLGPLDFWRASIGLVIR